MTTKKVLNLEKSDEEQSAAGMEFEHFPSDV